MAEENKGKLGRVKLLKDFTPHHEKLSDANDADEHNAFVALMDKADFDTDYYSYRKELYTLVLGETVFLHIVNGIRENALLDKYLEKIEINSEIIRDSIDDPSFVIMLHLLKSAYFYQIGKIKESLSELAIFKTITSKFRIKEDIQYAAAMKGLIAKTDTPEVIKTFKKRIIILFNQQFAYVKQGIEKTEIIIKHSKV